MAVTRLSLSALIEWTLSRSIPGFASATEGDSQSFTLGAIDLTKFNQLLAVNYVIPPGGTQDFDLSTFTDLSGAAGGMTQNGVLSLLVLPTTGNVVLSPSPVNGLQWFFGSASDKTTCYAGGVTLVSLPAVGPGVTISGASRNLRLTNNGVAVAVGYLFAIGG